ncbi:MAG: sigma-70 family RNA polymerase sigma factor [Lentisphaeraceae bacterium]|nr:sigma-70 family RNA polymerase sigma factor [Lentisphaeraceae bacterium]
MSKDSTEDYLKLLAEHEYAIRVYIITMIPRLSDADDIMQEVRLIMWKKFGTFELGSNFKAWALQIAYYRIMDFRRRKGRENKKLIFTDEFYDAVEQASKKLNPEDSDKRQSLLNCVGKLQDQHKKIIFLRYKERVSIEEISEKIGRTVTATYRVISRIRASLKKCINTTEKAR